MGRSPSKGRNARETGTPVTKTAEQNRIERKSSVQIRKTQHHECFFREGCNVFKYPINVIIYQ
jgi:hypothetical protein